MAVSMTQNARYGESFAESFEDAMYNERINSGFQNLCANNRYINFAELGSNNIITASSAGINAHSGNNVLKINPGTSTVNLNTNTSGIADNFNFAFTEKTTGTLYETGGNITNIYSYPENIGYPNTPAYFENANMYGNGGVTATITPLDTVIGNTASHTFSVSGYCYVQIPTTGTYGLLTSVYTSYGNSRSAALWVYDMYGTEMGHCYFSAGPGSTDVSNGENVYICKPGIYKVVYNYNGSHTRECSPCYSITNDYTYQLAFYANSNSYKTLNYQNACTILQPMAGSEDMLNAKFSLPPGKKMQFSAWIKDTNSLSTIEVLANGSVLTSSLNGVKRKGTVIEGWQKVEGEFTVPSNVSSAQIRFTNANSSTPMYVDDIRIHPYNANMKGYVYDARTLRLSAELDENNYASFYEYDEEGQLVRVKKETIQGVKTIQETRSSKQKSVTDLQ
jgi:hypothetical protein